METKQEEEENEISTEDNGSEAMPIMANASTSVSSSKESTGNLSNKAKRVLQRLKKEKEVLTNKSILGKLEKFLGGNKRNAHQENTVVEEQLRQPLQPILINPPAIELILECNHLLIHPPASALLHKAPQMIWKWSSQLKP